MKNFSLLTITLFILFPLLLNAQGFVAYQTVSYTNINLRDSLHILARIDAFIPAAGDVVIRFTGECLPDAGDRIILAANNGPFWTLNYGNVGIQTTNANIGKSFSHTRVANYYESDIGMHSFYAVGQNWVEMAGNGFASIYGTLTIEFIPYGADDYLAQTGFSFNGDVTNTVVVQGVTVFAPSAGKVIAHVDGWCHSDVGDRIVFAASNTTNWSPNDGNVSVEAADPLLNINTFSHTREYVVPGAGLYIYNAVVQRSVETDGSGVVDMYGLMSAEFYADGSPVEVEFKGFSKPSVDFNDHTVQLTSISIDVPGPGKVLLALDGDMTSDPGDQIEIGASHQVPLLAENDDGNVKLQAIDQDLNRNCFALSRVYTVGAGQHIFYALGRTNSSTPGSGIADIYGELTVKYFPDQNTAVHDVSKSENEFIVYPDPTRGMFTVSLADGIRSDDQVKVLDIHGRTIVVKQGEGKKEINMDISSWPAGIYFVSVGDYVKRMMKM